MDTYTRPGARLLIVAVLALAGATSMAAPPARAQEQNTDSSAVARLEQTAAHLEQMLRTLRQNPGLEEQWAEEPVLVDAVAAARRGSRAASALARLDATLDSLRRDADAEGSEELADQLGRVSAETNRMRDALRAVAAEMAALRSVVHGEGAGAHPHPGSDTVAHGHAGASGHAHGGLHFAHPLATESVSPDTKLRLNFDHRNLPAGELENATALAAEWSPHRSFSIEASVPYSFSAKATGFTHLAVKFANYAFEEAGVSLGYGLGLSAPTSGAAPSHHHEEGHTHDEGGHASRPAAVSLRGGTPSPRLNGTGGVHGSLGKDLWTFEPFLNVGWKSGRWELVGFGTFGIPTNQSAGTEVATDFAYNASALFRAAPEVQATLELHGHTGLSGHDADRSVLNLTPGVKLRPSGDSPWFLGLAGSFPVSGDVSYDGRALLSFFYHFH